MKRKFEKRWWIGGSAMENLNRPGKKSRVVWFEILALVYKENLQRSHQNGIETILNTHTHARTRTHIYIYIYIYNSPKRNCPVSWGCTIRRLHLCRGVRPPPNECPDMTLNNLVPLRLELMGHTYAKLNCLNKNCLTKLNSLK